MTVAIQNVFRFADFEVRELEFCATRSGQPLAIEPKAFRVLLCLLHRAGSLVSKEELFKTVWGETAVTDNSLTRAIALLRRVLEDDPHQPHFIETVATAGYRFICPVNTENGLVEPAARVTHADVQQFVPESHGEPPSGSPEAKTRRRSGYRRLLVIVCIVIAVIILGTWYLHRPVPGLAVTKYVQITHAGRIKLPVATDGSRVYFNEWLSESGFCQVTVSGGEIGCHPEPVPGAFLEDVSPDGSYLLLSSVKDDSRSIWTYEPTSGALRHLADSSCVGAAWSPDGAFVAYITAFGEIVVIDSNGTSARTLVPAGSSKADRNTLGVAWSPNGARLRFSRLGKLWEISSDGGGLHTLLPEWRPGLSQGPGRWTVDGETFVFVSEAPDSRHGQLFALDERQSLWRRVRHDPVQLTSPPMQWDRVVIGRDRKTIFSRGMILRGELVRFDGQSKQLRPYLGGISADWVTFSPDGIKVAYVSYPEGILWTANRDGTNPTRLTDPPLYPVCVRWSPDGSRILFTAGSEAYTVSSGGGNPERLLARDGDSLNDPNWSPDGGQIVYASQPHGGPGGYRAISSDIRIADLNTQSVKSLPGSSGLSSPRWSRDGRYIAALSLDSLNVFDLKSQHWSKAAMGAPNFPTFSHDSRFIYFLILYGKPGVYRIPVSGGDAQRVVDLDGFRHTGSATFWMGLDPDDSPMLLREMGSDDIFALTLERK